jgi:hypothetical protein
MSQVQDELEISETGDRVAEPRLDAVAVPAADTSNTVWRRDESIGLLIVTGFAYFIANIAVRQILRGSVNEAGIVFGTAIVGSQWILLSIWLGLGNWPLPVRLLASMLLVAVGLLVITDDRRLRDDFWQAVCGSTLLLVISGLPFGLIKLFGLRMYHTQTLAAAPIADLSQTDRRTQRQPRRIQFSVRNLLSWTASAGLVAALFRVVGPFDLIVIEPISIYVGITVALGGTSLWAAMSHGHPWPRAAAPLAVAIIIGLFFAVSDAPSDIKMAIIMTAILCSVAVLVVLLLFRRLGWRIAFRPPVPQPTHAVG